MLQTMHIITILCSKCIRQAITIHIALQFASIYSQRQETDIVSNRISIMIWPIPGPGFLVSYVVRGTSCQREITLLNN